MANYRVTLLFEKSAGTPLGHSERWDFAAADDSAAKSLASKVAGRRAAFLPNNWFVRTVRVGLLTAFKRADNVWRFKQTSVAICTPPSIAGSSNPADIDGGAVYYRFQYLNAPGKASVRLFTPIYESWWNTNASLMNVNKALADGEIIPWSDWLRRNAHQLSRIDKVTGATTFFPLDCVSFQRGAMKKLGRPFFQRRGRRFAHRTHHA